MGLQISGNFVLLAPEIRRLATFSNLICMETVTDAPEEISGLQAAMQSRYSIPSAA